MVNRRYTLSKEERLSWKRYIDLLFEKGQSFVAFPLRVVYLAVEEETLAPVSILVSVPKKKFRRAVKRNLIKRQVREAYRVRKYDLIDPLTLIFAVAGQGVDHRVDHLSVFLSHQLQLTGAVLYGEDAFAVWNRGQQPACRRGLAGGGGSRHADGDPIA